jgi:VWFA-related protein
MYRIGCVFLAVTVLAQETQPILRVTTRLVQVSVVAHDKRGQPVAGLTKDDFTLYEKGKPRKIAFFSVVEGNKFLKVAAGAQPPPNLFSNRVKGAETATSATVILFDALNTRFEDQVYAKAELIKFLETLRPEDRAAIYLLTGKLIILQDFTNEPEHLLKALVRYRAHSAGAPLDSASSDDMDRFLQNTVWGESEMFGVRRVEWTLKAMELIAEHVAGVPGRKNLIWFSAGFPLSLGFGLEPGQERRSNSPAQEQRIFGPEVEHATRALNNAGVAIYPVDARGLVGIPESMQASSRGTLRQIGLETMSPPYHDTMRALADQTGGRAFYNTNDLEAATRTAFDDSAISYTLGYYADADDFDSKYHPFKVGVNRQGLDLRYRKGFVARPEVMATGKQSNTDIDDALRSPLEATGIGINVRIDPIDQPKPGTTRMLIQIAQDSIRLEAKEDRTVGVIDVVVTQYAPNGRSLARTNETLNLNLSREDYERVMQSGIVLTETLEPNAEAYQYRVVVYDRSTGRVGSIFVPVKKGPIANRPAGC